MWSFCDFNCTFRIEIGTFLCFNDNEEGVATLIARRLDTASFLRDVTFPKKSLVSSKVLQKIFFSVHFFYFFWDFVQSFFSSSFRVLAKSIKWRMKKIFNLFSHYKIKAWLFCYLCFIAFVAKMLFFCLKFLIGFFHNIIR